MRRGIICIKDEPIITTFFFSGHPSTTSKKTNTIVSFFGVAVGPGACGLMDLFFNGFLDMLVFDWLNFIQAKNTRNRELRIQKVSFVQRVP